jgi:hypothetical protein
MKKLNKLNKIMVKQNKFKSNKSTKNNNKNKFKIKNKHN